MRGMAASLIIMVAVFAVFALLGRIVGFEVALLPSLLISVGLTLVLNLALGGFRGRGYR
ncbi:MAG TPA: hypothetical protein VK524_35160 [Polyangiaceae bacterium]|nr:hypothetical protein [Polyangiaceae bacterium]